MRWGDGLLIGVVVVLFVFAITAPHWFTQATDFEDVYGPFESNASELPNATCACGLLPMFGLLVGVGIVLGIVALALSWLTTRNPPDDQEDHP